MKRGRIRVLAGFLSFGIFWGAWGAMLPALKQQSCVGDGEFGIAVLMIGLGALCSMRPTGRAIDRFGRSAVTGSIVAMAVAGFLPGLAASGAALAALLAVTGAASGAMDVGINALAVQEEAHSGPLLSAAHACFSGAVVVAALSTGALLDSGVSLRSVLGIVSLITAATAVAVHTLSTDEPSPASGCDRQRAPWTRSLMVLGGFCALAYLVENVWQSWAAVLLRTAFSSSSRVAATGPALFAASASVGRGLSHRLLSGKAERPVLVGGALVGAAGTFAAASAPTASLMLLGVVVAGLGTSVCAPTILSMAGRSAPAAQRASAVSVVTTLGYAGFLVGPGAVGLTASATGLRTALACVGLVAIALAVCSAAVRVGSKGGEAAGPSRLASQAAAVHEETEGPV
jgi:MFS family permease